MTDPSESPEIAKGQPLIEHLIELRSRLLKIAGFILIVFIPLFFFANDIYSYVSSPLRAFLPEGATMIATEVASPFLTPFKLALVLAIFIAIPFILHQIWAFVAPGLYANEKRFAVPLLTSSIVLFYAGIGGVSSVYVPVISNVFLLATLIPAASAGCRRMHDVGRSGWFQIIPLINLVWLCEESDKSSSNKF